MSLPQPQALMQHPPPPLWSQRQSVLRSPRREFAVSVVMEGMTRQAHLLGLPGKPGSKLAGLHPVVVLAVVAAAVVFAVAIWKSMEHK